MLPKLLQLLLFVLYPFSSSRKVCKAAKAKHILNLRVDTKFYTKCCIVCSSCCHSWKAEEMCIDIPLFLCNTITFNTLFLAFHSIFSLLSLNPKKMYWMPTRWQYNIKPLNIYKHKQQRSNCFIIRTFWKKMRLLC